MPGRNQRTVERPLILRVSQDRDPLQEVKTLVLPVFKSRVLRSVEESSLWR